MAIKAMLIDDHPVVRAGLRAILDSFADIEVVAEGASGAAVQCLNIMCGIDETVGLV